MQTERDGIFFGDNLMKLDIVDFLQQLNKKPAAEKRIAVKVIDHRGNEVKVVREIGKNE